MKLTRLSDVRTLLEQLNIYPAKKLGQNFLVDFNILNIILDTARLNPEDEILEIGAGLGVLTDPLARIARRVVIVEKDKRLWPWLKSRYEQTSNVELICADMMKLDSEALIESGINKVISNLPYSVGSAILVNFLKTRRPPEQITVTLQLEVAKRLIADPGQTDFGLLSLWSQLIYDIKIRKIISPACFHPSPNVKSAIIQLVRRDTPVVELISKDYFFDLTKFVFSQRRKQLKTIFRHAPQNMNLSTEHVMKIFRKLQMDPVSRPGTLSVAKWCHLANALYSHE